MLQYLLNVTAVWLLGLLCFDLFLKRETWHGYNRAYLLFTLLAGILIPLYSRPSFTATALTQPPLRRVDEVKNTLVQTATPAEAHNFSWTTLVAWLYIAGAAISLLFLLHEVWVLIRYYRTGKKSKQNGNTIIETYRDHGPFSVAKMIFVSSRKNYDDEQWQIVVQHEQRHTQLLHFADMIIIQLVQIVFWFHPLVYLYRRRLLLVHEYQADAVAAAQPLQYGHFLIEQSLLQRGPLPAHSFNRSPIKNRITMLTKNASSKMTRAKYWLLTPVLVIGLICCAKTKNVISYERKIEGNKMTYKGNVFEMSEQRMDTVLVTDVATNQERQVISKIPPQPITVNGKKIIERFDLEKKPECKGSDKKPTIAVFNHLVPDFEKLEDGEYGILIENVVIDEKGNLVYYDVPSIGKIGKDAFNSPGDKAAKEVIGKSLDQYLSNDEISFTPGIYNGQAVPCSIEIDLTFRRIIVIKDHKATLTER